ncbi:protein phosphatase Slingshot homolog 2-like isoform X1 [Acipenser ruthenus]|uniref:protein phosphatase Slingshot homolog 2-like isoform X1 n=1 Tax=Acipenser ruthenus TaxID=7906 RepID=UPI002740B513|nr:protein phosphatase Slingshot homolog 2-like isoform X1 [Acipenser ruthenus]
MTRGTLSGGGRSGGECVCSGCGVKMMPYFSDNAVISQNTINQLISENFLTVKGAALFLPRGNGSPGPRVSQRHNKHAGDLQQHLQAMFTLLRPEDNIRLAVRLESAFQSCMRYIVVVSTNGRQDTEESIVLGMDFNTKDSSSCTLGLVLPLWSDTLIHLDGDGGFSVSTVNRVHVFKPVSVQAMWSSLQSLHKACEVARCHNYYPGSLFLTWISYYESRVSSDQVCINEWNAMQDVQSHRADSPVLFTDVPTERERTERLIKTKLREIMMQKDLENITSKEIRTELEMQMVCNLREFKEYIDNEMIVILGQMDSPTEIFEHVFLGSEWNASNLEDLQNRGIRYILNVTREIDNFFPGVFEYHNIRVYDEEATDLLAYWNDTFKFISKAKKAGSKCLVHCKMGVSRSASTVIAYAMKEYGWNLERAHSFVKDRRTVTNPNPSFMRQLEEYQGILLASKQRHNKLWRSHSESDLSGHHEPDSSSKPPLNLNFTRKDSDNNNSPLGQFLGMAVLQVLTTEPEEEEDELEEEEEDDEEEEEEEEEGLQLEFQPCPDPSAGEPASESVLGPCGGEEPGPDSPLLDCPPVLIELKETALADSEEDALGAEQSPASSLSGATDPVSLDPLEQETGCLETAQHPNNNNNPGESPSPSPSPSPALSSLSTDSIDFFSAREKFLELSQDGRARSLSQSRTEEQAAGRTPHPSSSSSSSSRGPSQELLSAEECAAVPAEEPVKEQPADVSSPLARSQSENGISVKDIVTELESINQGCAQCRTDPAAPTPAPAPLKRNTIHDLPGESAKPPRGEEEEEGQILGTSLQRDPETENLPWPGEAAREGSVPKTGSVKRVTKELEQRLRHEQDLTLLTQKNSRHDEPPSIEISGPPYEPGDCEPAPQENQPAIQTEGSSEAPGLQGGVRCKTSVGEPAEPAGDNEGSPVSETPSTGTLLPDLLSTPRIRIVKITELVPIPTPRPTSPATWNTQAGQCNQAASLEETGHPLEESSVGEKKEDEEEQSKGFVFHQTLPQVGQSVGPCACHLPSQTPDTQNTEDSSPCLSRLPPFPNPGSSQSFVRLEGATVQSSDTDSLMGALQLGGYPNLQQSTEELNKIQETVRELQAFLGNSTSPRSSSGVLLGACASLPHSSSSSVSVAELPPGAVRQRAREIEALIRQAGLTTPSLMKRSASLAKLGCLELSADDLSERGAGLAAVWKVTSVSWDRGWRRGTPEDPFKKLRVSSQPSQQGEPTPCMMEQLRTEGSVALSRPVEFPDAQYAKTCGETQDSESSPSRLCQAGTAEGILPLVPRQQHGRTHPLRRVRKNNEKKRTASFLYNTM